MTLSASNDPVFELVDDETDDRTPEEIDADSHDETDGE